LIEIRDAAIVLGQCHQYGNFIGAMVDVSNNTTSNSFNIINQQYNTGLLLHNIFNNVYCKLQNTQNIKNVPDSSLIQTC